MGRLTIHKENDQGNKETNFFDTQFRCYHCASSFEYKWNLKRHIERTHNRNKVFQNSVFCVMCDYQCRSRPEMMVHYAKAHDVDCSVRLLQFDNVESFEEWKTRLEVEETARYVKLRSARKTGAVMTWTAICHRNGNFKTNGKGKRRVKKIGSNKINGCCPSQMNVSVTSLSGTVVVKYIKTHLGHTQDLGRMPLSSSHRNMIAQQLRAGLSYEEIIENIRNDLSESKIERVHLITRQDVVNIARDFNIGTHLDTKSTRHSSINATVIVKTAGDTSLIARVNRKTARDSNGMVDTNTVRGSNINAEVDLKSARKSNVIAMFNKNPAREINVHYRVDEKAVGECRANAPGDNQHAADLPATGFTITHRIDKSASQSPVWTTSTPRESSTEPQLGSEESDRYSCEAMMVDGNADFEERLKVMKDLWRRIESEVKQISDIDIVISHLKSVLPAIHAANNDPLIDFKG